MIVFLIMLMAGMAFLTYYLYKNPNFFSNFFSNAFPTPTPAGPEDPYALEDRIIVSSDPDNSNFTSYDKTVKGVTLKDHMLLAGTYKTYMNTKLRSFGIMPQGGTDDTPFKGHTGTQTERGWPHEAILTNKGQLMIYDAQGFPVKTWGPELGAEKPGKYELRLQEDAKLYIYKHDLVKKQRILIWTSP